MFLFFVGLDLHTKKDADIQTTVRRTVYVKTILEIVEQDFCGLESLSLHTHGIRTLGEKYANEWICDSKIFAVHIFAYSKKGPS